MKTPKRPPDFIDKYDWKFWFEEKVTQVGEELDVREIRFLNKKFEWKSNDKINWLEEESTYIYDIYKKWLISKELKKRLK